MTKSEESPVRSRTWKAPIKSTKHTSPRRCSIDCWIGSFERAQFKTLHAASTCHAERTTRSIWLGMSEPDPSQVRSELVKFLCSTGFQPVPRCSARVENPCYTKDSQAAQDDHRSGATTAK